jgi:hypothetical protein
MAKKKKSKKKYSYKSAAAVVVAVFAVATAGFISGFKSSPKPLTCSSIVVTGVPGQSTMVIQGDKLYLTQIKGIQCGALKYHDEPAPEQPSGSIAGNF